MVDIMVRILVYQNIGSMMDIKIASLEQMKLQASESFQVGIILNLTYSNRFSNPTQLIISQGNMIKSLSIFLDNNVHTIVQGRMYWSILSSF